MSISSDFLSALTTASIGSIQRVQTEDFFTIVSSRYAWIHWSRYCRYPDSGSPTYYVLIWLIIPWQWRNYRRQTEALPTSASPASGLIFGTVSYSSQFLINSLTQYINNSKSAPRLFLFVPLSFTVTVHKLSGP